MCISLKSLKRRFLCLLDVHCYSADPENLKEFVSCVKCKQEFDHDTHKPFLLPCSDAVCKSCTQAISALESQSYECHKCHGDHICFQNGKTNLHTDSTRELVTKIFRLTSGKTSLACEMCTNNKLVSHRCFECSLFICTDCVKLHSTLKAFGSHSFVEIDRLLTTKMENLKRVRCDEKVAENACETTIDVFRKKIDLIVKQARIFLAELENIDKKSQQDLQQVQEEIKSHFSDVKKAIEEREKMLYDAAATQLSKKQSCIESEKVQLNLFIGLCEQASFYGEFSEINNHEYFLDIARIIQSRLETSERHFSENKVSMDAMKFFTQPEFSFKTAVSNIGKLSVSKAISSKSKVEVKPAFCNVGQEVQFQVQLFSSTGNFVVDEDVSVCLMVNRNIFKNIKCAIDESISSFIGLWVPGEPMKLSWIVVSNGITLTTLNGVLDLNEPNESICGRIIISIDNHFIFYFHMELYICYSDIFLCFADDGKKQISVSSIIVKLTNDIPKTKLKVPL